MRQPTDSKSMADNNNNNNNNNDNGKAESTSCNTVEPPNTPKLTERASNDHDIIDSERNVDQMGGEQEKKVPKPSCFSSLRFYIMFLALTSPFAVTYSKQQINFVILGMIHPSMLKPSRPVNITIGDQYYFEVDNSCPVDQETRDRLIEELETSEHESLQEGEKFMWDTKIQGYLKASYSIGHLPLQIVGSRVSETYGSHQVMTMSSLCMAICCLVAPIVATVHYSLLMTDLAILGMLGGFMTPAMVNLFSNWLTPREKSLFMSFYLVASRLGSALSVFIGFQLLDSSLSWRYIFYSAALINFTFCGSFFILASSKPVNDKRITRAELDYLASKNRLVRESMQARDKANSATEIELKATPTGSAETNTTHKKAKRKKEPLFAIFINRSVWAFILTKYFVKVVGDLAEKELPSYLTRVMHVSKKWDGFINALNYVIFSAGCLFSGILSGYLIKNHPFDMSKNAIRKLMQSMASFGCSFCLIGIALSVCDLTATAFFFGLLFCMTTMGAGGEAQMPFDLSERYSGTIHAMASSIASTSGFLTPILIGIINSGGGGGADRNTWNNIWIGASVMSLIGGLVFIFFADAKIQPFDSIELDDEATSEKKSDPSEEISVKVDSNGKSENALRT